MTGGVTADKLCPHIIAHLLCLQTVPEISFISNRPQNCRVAVLSPRVTAVLQWVYLLASSVALRMLDRGHTFRGRKAGG